MAVHNIDDEIIDEIIVEWGIGVDFLYGYRND